jgi:hypothetical protein
MNQMHGSAAIYAASSDQDRVCFAAAKASRQGWIVVRPLQDGLAASSTAWFLFLVKSR